MTNQAARLAACPFCGGASAITIGCSSAELPWSDDGGEFHRVYCAKCQSRQLFHRTESEAIEAWNHRTTLTQPAVSEDEKDAARYRWIRAEAVNFGGEEPSAWCVIGTCYEDSCVCDGDQLDAAIDAARASSSTAG